MLLNNLMNTQDEKLVHQFKSIKELNYGSKINDLTLYNSKEKPLDPELESAFKVFPGLYYLPPYFWNVLLNKGTKKFSNILFEVSNKSYLIWNQMAFLQLKKNLKGKLKGVLENFAEKRDNPFQHQVMKYSFADELICGPLILKNYVIDRRKKFKVSKPNLKLLKNMLYNKFVEALNRIKALRFKEEELRQILMDIHLILDVQANVFKHYHNFVYRGYNYLVDFIDIYIAVSGTLFKYTPDESASFRQKSSRADMRSVMTIEKKFEKQKTYKDVEEEESSEEEDRVSEEDVDNGGDDFSFMNQSFPQIQHLQELYLNIFDYCLINVLKLIRNTLDPQGNIKNFVKFNSNKGLKNCILKLMQRNVLEQQKGAENYTFNRFQINFFFLGIMLNIYERNGYTLHSFGDKNQENLYEIEHVLTNMDTRILRYFIEFIQQQP